MIVKRITVVPAIVTPCRLYIKNSNINFSTVALLLSLSGDIELNPGPVRFPCGVCGRAVQSNHRGICCDQCDVWYHIGCANVTNDQYMRLTGSSESWICNDCLLETQLQRQPGRQEVTNTHEHRQQTTEQHSCGECHRALSINDRAVCCNECNKWFHLRCANITSMECTSNWTCPGCVNRQDIHEIRLFRQQQVEEERELVHFRCGICHRAVQNNHRGICCDNCNNWFHVRCANVSASQYRTLSNSSESWLCNGCHGVTCELGATPDLNKQSIRCHNNNSYTLWDGAQGNYISNHGH
jgi:hypothetical protein